AYPPRHASRFARGTSVPPEIPPTRWGALGRFRRALSPRAPPLGAHAARGRRDEAPTIDARTHARAARPHPPARRRPPPRRRLRPPLDDRVPPHLVELRARPRARAGTRDGQAAPGARALAGRLPLGERSPARLRARRDARPTRELRRRGR